MTDLHKAAQQALEFVEFCWRDVAMNDYAEEQRVKTEAALREALAKPAVPASFTDEDMKASWLTGFKEAEFQFRGGTEKSGEFPAKTPLSVAPQAAPPKQPSVPPGYALVPIEPTPEMLAAYLTANKAYWERADQIVPHPDKWRNGTPTKATAESYRAMLAARPEALK